MVVSYSCQIRHQSWTSEINQSATVIYVAIEKGVRVLHIVFTAPPPAFVDMPLADALVQISSIATVSSYATAN